MRTLERTPVNVLLVALCYICALECTRLEAENITVTKVFTDHARMKDSAKPTPLVRRRSPESSLNGVAGKIRVPLAAGEMGIVIQKNALTVISCLTLYLSCFEECLWPE